MADDRECVSAERLAYELWFARGAGVTNAEATVRARFRTVEETSIATENPDAACQA